jgi:hypothetical protein
VVVFAQHFRDLSPHSLLYIRMQSQLVEQEGQSRGSSLETRSKKGETLGNEVVAVNFFKKGETFVSM